MNSLILLAALALVPFVPATISGQNAGCDQCECGAAGDQRLPPPFFPIRASSARL